VATMMASRVNASAEHTILIVEDEVLIRFDVADYLRSCGYQVIEAANASEALSILQSGRRVDLMFSDVQLPGSMDGFALARWVRTHRPEVRVLLTSGATRSTEIAGELCEDGPLEKKPYEPQQLLRRIRASLARVRQALPNEPEKMRSVR
jgi:DNA-binding response OmpR family regulator